jgi:hypothetical protein
MFLIAAVLGLMIPVEGRVAAELLYRDTGLYGEYGHPLYQIALAFDDGPVSEWVDYPGDFNPAKTYCEFRDGESVLAIVSQRPFSANYSYADYLVVPSGNLELEEWGVVDYYGEIAERVSLLLSEGSFYEAFDEAMDMMYPGAMPDAGEMCAAFVEAAAAVGTYEAFQMAGDVCLNTLGIHFTEIEHDSHEFEAALRLYSRLELEATR